MKKYLFCLLVITFFFSFFTSYAQWLNKYCTTCSTGCYISAGTITPTAVLQTKSTYTTPSNYGYVFWTFTATAGTTYYFDLCSSTGTSATSRLRLHNARNTSPNNNYCMNGNNLPTLVLENTANGCAGTGTGLSKLIWTCITGGTYYLESCSDDIDQYWGVAANQSANLKYKTLPSTSTTCSDIFNDKGGDGTNGSFWNYNNNEDWFYTYYPDTAGNKITVQFTSFNVLGGDVLSIYDGNSTAAPLLGSFTGATLPGVFTSTAADGSMTFHFTSNDTGTLDGWEANVSCISALSAGSAASVNRIKIYPNPAHNQFTVYGLQFAAGAVLEFYNILGKKVYSYRPEPVNNKQANIIDVSNLPAGIYFVQIENEKIKWNGRFIKQ